VEALQSRLDRLRALRTLRVEVEQRTIAALPPDPWEALARPAQRLPVGDWLIWLMLAGRGFGKTRSGAQ